MREKTSARLSAVFRRAPMGLVQAAGFIVAGGAMITGALTIAVLPADAPGWAWWVWSITLASAAFLFLRGVIGIGAWAVHRGWIVSATARERGLPHIRIEWPKVNQGAPSADAPSVPRDPKWERGDQLSFEGMSLLDSIRKGGDRHEQASAWLADVREFLRVYNPTAWAMFDAPTGLLPYRNSGYPRAMVDIATDVDRALFLIRLTNPRHYARAGVAQGRISAE